MKKEELHNFIYFMVHNKNLTQVQKNMVSKLVEQHITVEEQNTRTDNSDKETNSFTPLSAFNTYKFLSGFNDPMGLKYLTHDFDYEMGDDRPTTWTELISQIMTIWKTQPKDNRLPRSLWNLFNNFIFGQSPWLDMFGHKHNSFIQNPTLTNWCSETDLHPIHNETFNAEIQSFKNATRIRNNLEDLVIQISRCCGVKINTKKLEAADFYTNTLMVYSAIKRIIEQTMKSHNNDNHEISVHFSRERSNGHRFQVVTITQKDSFAKKNILHAIERLEKSPEAGDFGSIRNLLNGYCLWSVESIWEGEAKRWNILRESQSDVPEHEDISPENVPGFVHILKFYQS